MADIDIDPFGNHYKTCSHLYETGESIPLNPGGGGPTWEPERDQETSFGGSLREKVLKERVKGL